MSNRKFNVLIVEDEKDISEFIEAAFIKCCDQINITKVTSRDEAFRLFDSGVFFDYVTLDLSIPNEPDNFEKDSANGMAVLGKIVELSHGTPILILTGTSTPDMIQDFLSNSSRVDIWGSGIERGTIEHLTKSKIGDLSNKIQEVYSEFYSILEVELITENLSIPIKYDRILRVFINKLGGSLGTIHSIGGGMSKAKVYFVKIQDNSGCIIHNAICKCGPKEDINLDALNYDNFINRLRPEATPRKLGHLKYAASSSCGVLYGLAEEYEASFFKASLSVQLDDEIESAIKYMLGPWHSSSKQERKSIKEIRQQLVTDEVADELFSKYQLSNAESFESKSVNCKVSCTHGDFHGENILLNVPSKKATLIDYGDVCEGVSILDPLTLECSFLFHPSTKGSLSDWPKEQNIENWHDVDVYAEGCEFEKSIKFCRSWIRELGIGNRELAACLYSYSLRQLKYDDTNKGYAVALINVAYGLYEIS